MHIEFIDLLRCPVAHEDSWLVAAVTRMDGRIVLEGKLGCPVCNASYAVRDGAALLQADTIRDAPRGVAQSGNELEDDVNDVNAATRVAAFLELTRPGSLALLAGTWARA